MSTPGDMVGGFELLRSLGEGPFGTVWLVSDVNGTPAALKLLKPAFVKRHAGQAAFNRLLSSIRVHQQLRHEGLVAVYGPIEDTEKGALGMVTEYLEGRAMSRVRLPEQARSGGDPRSLASLLRWFEMVADVLGWLHAQGVVHGNLKPNNIMLVRRPNGHQLKVLDLPWSAIGLAAPAPGQPTYLAPEQVGGGAPTPASDQWSLATLLYRILTANDERSGLAGYPTMLVAALHRAMSTNPTERLPEVQVLGSALQDTRRELENQVVGPFNSATPLPMMGTPSPTTPAPYHAGGYPPDGAPTETLPQPTFARPNPPAGHGQPSQHPGYPPNATYPPQPGGYPYPPPGYPGYPSAVPAAGYPYPQPYPAPYPSAGGYPPPGYPPGYGGQPPPMMPGQVPPGYGPAGQMPPGQMPPGQMPPGQMPAGQMPPGQMPPGQMPAQPHPSAPPPPAAEVPDAALTMRRTRGESIPPVPSARRVIPNETTDGAGDSMDGPMVRHSVGAPMQEDLQTSPIEAAVADDPSLGLDTMSADDAAGPQYGELPFSDGDEPGLATTSPTDSPAPTPSRRRGWVILIGALLMFVVGAVVVTGLKFAGVDIPGWPSGSEAVPAPVTPAPRGAATPPPAPALEAAGAVAAADPAPEDSAAEVAEVPEVEPDTDDATPEVDAAPAKSKRKRRKRRRRRKPKPDNLEVSLAKVLGEDAVAMDDDRIGCDEGVAAACVRAARRAQKGGDREQARADYVRACDFEDREGCYQAGRQWAKVGSEQPRALGFFRRACVKSHAAGCAAAADILQTQGKTVEAGLLRQKACTLGDQGACQVAKAAAPTVAPAAPFAGAPTEPTTTSTAP